LLKLLLMGAQRILNRKLLFLCLRLSRLLLPLLHLNLLLRLRLCRLLHLPLLLCVCLPLYLHLHLRLAYLQLMHHHLQHHFVPQVCNPFCSAIFSLYLNCS